MISLDVNKASRKFQRMGTLLLLSFISSWAQAGKYSISGISSGGFMAGQMAIIYSSQFKSAGIVAGGFYGCAGQHFQDMIELSKKNMQGLSVFFSSEINIFSLWSGDLKNSIQLSPLNPLYQAVSICMYSPRLAVPDFEYLRKLEQNNLIDSLENLKGQKYLLYNGQRDSVVKFEMQKINQKYLADLGVLPENLKLLTSAGGHNFPTAKKGLAPCESQSIPYIASCDLDLAGEILSDAVSDTSTHRPLKKTEHYDDRVENNLFQINQKILLKDSEGHELVHPSSVASYGYLAASPFCLENPAQCHLHVALHGCEMSDSFDQKFDQSYAKGAQRRYLQMRDKKAFDTAPWLGLPYIEQRVPKMGTKKFAQLAGYAEYANDQNRLMVLFPQTWIGIEHYPANPKGCWDWYGWTDRQYLNKQGQEPSWLMKLTEEVAKDPKKYILRLASDEKPAMQAIQN